MKITLPDYQYLPYKKNIAGLFVYNKIFNVYLEK